MGENKIIGSNIKRIRERLGYTQEDVAAFLPVSRSLISLVESGERELNLDHLEKLANLFNVALIDLLEEKETLQHLNYAFAFRTTSLTATDLNSIADFQGVIKNYLKMKASRDVETGRN